jgi:hypothetical protein
LSWRRKEVSIYVSRIEVGCCRRSERVGPSKIELSWQKVKSEEGFRNRCARQSFCNGFKLSYRPDRRGQKGRIPAKKRVYSYSLSNDIKYKKISGPKRKGEMFLRITFLAEGTVKKRVKLPEKTNS